MRTCALWDNLLTQIPVEYVTCKTCKSGDTELPKGENRLYFITCNVSLVSGKFSYKEVCRRSNRFIVMRLASFRHPHQDRFLCPDRQKKEPDLSGHLRWTGRDQSHEKGFSPGCYGFFADVCKTACRGQWTVRLIPCSSRVSLLSI